MSKLELKIQFCFDFDNLYMSLVLDIVITSYAV